MIPGIVVTDRAALAQWLDDWHDESKCHAHDNGMTCCIDRLVDEVRAAQS